MCSFLLLLLLFDDDHYANYNNYYGDDLKVNNDHGAHQTKSRKKTITERAGRIGKYELANERTKRHFEKNNNGMQWNDSGPFRLINILFVLEFNMKANRPPSDIFFPTWLPGWLAGWPVELVDWAVGLGNRLFIDTLDRYNK